MFVVVVTRPMMMNDTDDGGMSNVCDDDGKIGCTQRKKGMLAESSP